MNEEKKKEVAAFRFGVIHDLVGSVVLDQGDKERLIREKCAVSGRFPIPKKHGLPEARSSAG